MIVHDLDIFGAELSPLKAHAELVVDSDAVLSGTISFQCFKSVSGRYPEVLQRLRDLKLPQLSASC
jgi:hypothetical protein